MYCILGFDEINVEVKGEASKTQNALYLTIIVLFL